MSKVLIIGAGGVANVTAHKCASNPEVFSGIMLASRTLSKCEAIAAAVRRRPGRTVATARLDADRTAAVVETIRGFGPDLVVHLALPYQNLAIMDACLETGVDYLDTANYESPEEAGFEYKLQWAYRERFARRGIMALLGSGFDPGATNVFCAHAAKHRLDEIHELDIMDCNAGDHGRPFATNFNPEINIREVTARGRYWDRGEWIETDPLAWSMTYDFPAGIGPRKCYLMYHEELESLVLNLPGLRRARFWMTFGDDYLKHLEVLGNVGLTRIDPVEFDGRRIVPLQFLRALLPDPAGLGAQTRGKTCIGCLMRGVRNGKPGRYRIYNVCDHQTAYAETGSQAISYTTGVPAMIGAMLMLTGRWRRPGVWNMEQLDPDPFMDAMKRHGLPWTEHTWND